MGGQRFAALGRVGGVNGLEEIQVRHLGVHNNYPVAGKVNRQVRLAVAGLGLLAEIAMGAHPGRLHHPAQGFLAPAPAGLVGTEHHAQLEGFAGKRLAVLRQSFELFPDFPQRRRLGGFALLEALLVGFQLLLQRLHQGGDGFLALWPGRLWRIPGIWPVFHSPVAEIAARVCFRASALKALNASRKSTSALSCASRAARRFSACASRVSSSSR